MGVSVVFIVTYCVVWFGFYYRPLISILFQTVSHLLFWFPGQELVQQAAGFSWFWSTSHSCLNFAVAHVDLVFSVFFLHFFVSYFD